MTERASKRIRRTIRRASPERQVTTKSTIISVQRAEHSASQQITYTDEFETVMQGLFVPTPYNVFRLYEFIDRSNMLPQCIESCVVNTVGTGWEIGKADRNIEEDADELDVLQSFADNANSEQSLSAVMREVIRDRESAGFGFLEVIRDRTGTVAMFRHAPSLHTRLAYKHPDEVLAAYSVRRGKRMVQIREFRKFRRFLQVINGRTVWFKEFGDPRKLNRFSGLFEHEEGFEDGADATEIIHFKIGNSVYGVPRWINQLPSIIGSREAEEVNMRYFEDNTVPPMMLTVGGGRLTRESYESLQRMLKTAGVGKERQNQIMIIEAVGEQDSLDSKGTPIQLKVERLTDQRPSDALFKDYDEANQAKVRSSFRLPAVAVGMANEHNFATAATAMFAVEAQVFAPMREEIDEILNKKIVSGQAGLGFHTVKLVSRTPAITSPEMMMKSMTALNVMGAMTPRAAQKIANKMLQIEMDEYPEIGEDGYEEWTDKPIVFVTSGKDTHDAQNQKDEDGKRVEDTGDVSMKQPEHGKE